MRIVNSLRCVVALAALLSATTGWAQQGNVNQKIIDSYHLSASAIHNMHAYEHARLLWRLSNTGQSFPTALLKEHAAGIRANLQASSNELTKMSDEAKKHPQLAAGLNTMQARLNQLQNQTTLLETAAVTSKVELLTQEIGQGLNDNLRLAQQLNGTGAPAQGAPTQGSPVYADRTWPSDEPYHD